VVFLVIDVTWKLFSQTGNIEAYLLLKELEKDPLENKNVEVEYDNTVSLDSLM